MLLLLLLLVLLVVVLLLQLQLKIALVRLAASPSCRMIVRPLRILADNYCYFLTDEATGTTAVVDPAEPERVLEHSKALDLRLSALLCTHKHWDHSGGNETVAKEIPGIRVYGGAEEPVPAMTHPLKDGETFNIGELQVQTMHVPCHTTGHVMYLVTDAGRKQTALFSGDTLFLSGCGRFFEGNAEQMQSNMDRIAQLPDDTTVYCGHEYSAQNLAFAKSIEPDNADLQKKTAWCVAQLAAGNFTYSTVAEEKSYNPFMRSHIPAIQHLVETSDKVSTMAAVRERKNNFKA